MCRTLSIGCAGLLVAGILVAIGFAAIVMRQARTVAPPLPEAPVSVDGACPKDEVLRWAAGNEARFDELYAPMGSDEHEQLDVDMDRDEALDTIMRIDVPAMRAAREAYAAQPLPACLDEVRAAELEMADMVIRAVASVQRSRGPAVVSSAGAILGLIRGTADRLDRIKDGHARLGERIGVDLEAVMWPGDQEPAAVPTGP